VFDSLSVRENLEIGGYLLKKREVPAAIERVCASFPALAGLQRSVAGKLSGGERKMLAMARVMMLEPTVVILDEPSAGLAPAVAGELLENQVPALARSGAAVLLVEQRAIQALEHSQWAYVMVGGTEELSGPAAQILARGDVGELFLGRGSEQSQQVAGPART
jgi:ABC-type branched-subunit amino acid transport system ATPase component